MSPAFLIFSDGNEVLPSPNHEGYYDKNFLNRIMTYPFGRTFTEEEKCLTLQGMREVFESSHEHNPIPKTKYIDQTVHVEPIHGRTFTELSGEVPHKLYPIVEKVKAIVTKLHQEGFIHGAITKNNIVIDSQDNVYLLNPLGYARWDKSYGIIKSKDLVQLEEIEYSLWDESSVDTSTDEGLFEELDSKVEVIYRDPEEEKLRAALLKRLAGAPPSPSPKKKRVSFSPTKEQPLAIELQENVCPQTPKKTPEKARSSTLDTPSKTLVVTPKKSPLVAAGLGEVSEGDGTSEVTLPTEEVVQRPVKRQRIGSDRTTRAAVRLQFI